MFWPQSLKQLHSLHVSLPRYRCWGFFLIEKQIFGVQKGLIVFLNEYLEMIVVALTVAN